MKKLKQQYRKWFLSYKLIHSTSAAPGIFMSFIKHKSGSRWVRIAITNRQKIQGYNPVTDIPFESVTRVDVIPCRFIRKVCKLLHIKLKYKQLKLVDDNG